MNNWRWDGDVWDYDPDQEAPWLFQDGQPILTGEIKCASKIDAEYIVKACNLFPELVKMVDKLASKLERLHFESDKDDLDIEVLFIESDELLIRAKQ